MAITRAQQVRQMLKAGGGMLVSPSEDGKRPGYRFGDERDTRGFREKVDKQVKDEQAAANREDRRRTQSDRPKSTTKSVQAGTQKTGDAREDYISNYVSRGIVKGGGDIIYDYAGRPIGAKDARVSEGALRRNQLALDNAAAKRGQDQLMKFRDTRPGKSKYPGLIGVGVNALNAIFPNLRKRNIDYFLENQAIDRRDYPTTIEGYKRYMRDRSGGVIDASGRDITDRGGRDDPMPLIHNQGQVGIGSGDNEETEDSTNNDPFEPNFRLLAGGGMPDDAPVGGIMDLESARQMYGLGKLVKKATRAVKKIAKSPIGKAALVAGGLGLAGVGPFAGLKTSSLGKFLMGTKAGPYSKTGFLQKMFLKNPSLGFSLGNLSGTAMIGIPTALSYFMTPKQDQDEEEPYLGPTLDVAGIEERPYDFINYRQAADGGLMRIGYQEGSKEPVAKKTMPLLDMNGKEKDYRETGGFVDMGRMERADDVPARLSKNEFVFTADAVRNAGEGDIDKGAEVMYNMMKNLEAGGEVSEESQGLEGARKMFQTSQRLGEVI